MIRKLPPDDDLAAIIRFGFRYADIAERFEVTIQAVSEHARRLGFEPVDRSSDDAALRPPPGNDDAGFPVAHQGRVKRGEHLNL